MGLHEAITNLMTREHTTRQTYQLTDYEFREKNRLGREPGEGWNFWKRVAARLGIDYKSILPNYDEPHSRRSFTALPMNHAKHWCYPFPLKCKTDPKSVKIDEFTDS